MDFVTHACVGALVGRALAPAPTDETSGPRASRPWVRLGALVAVLPDADHVLELVSAETYLLHHRTFSHSLLMGAALCVAAAALRGPQRGRRAAVAAAAFASHLLLDVLTPFGTGILWPSPRMEAWDGLQLVAPWLFLLCALGAGLASWRGRQSLGAGRKASLGALVVVAAFLGSQVAVARRAASSLPAPPALAVPSWSKPWEAVAFAVQGDRLRHLQLGGGAVREVAAPERFLLEPTTAALAAAREAAREHVAHFRLPVARQEEGGVVVFEDAQFWAIDPDKPPLKIFVSPAGEVTVWEQARPAQFVIWLLVFGAALLLTRAPRVSGGTDAPGGPR